MNSTNPHLSQSIARWSCLVSWCWESVKAKITTNHHCHNNLLLFVSALDFLIWQRLWKRLMHDKNLVRTWMRFALKGMVATAYICCHKVLGKCCAVPTGIQDHSVKHPILVYNKYTNVRDKMFTSAVLYIPPMPRFHSWNQSHYYGR